MIASQPTIHALHIMVRVPLYPVEPDDVESALTWLEDHWHGEPYVPDKLLSLVAVA